MTDPPLQYNVDGEVIPAGDATVSVRDRGFLYGDAIVETLRAYGGTVFRWDAHADRIDAAAAAIPLEHGHSPAALKRLVDETLAANPVDDLRLRLSITRGRDSERLTPPGEIDPTVVVQVTPLPRGGVDGDPVWDDPASLQTVKTRRIPEAAVPAAARTHNALDRVRARGALRVSEADEAVMLDADGRVVGGADSALFALDGEALQVPSTGGVAGDVLRGEVLDIAEHEGIPVRDGSLAPDDLRDAAEAFVANPVWGIRPVGTVDGIAVGGGPVTTLFRRVFDRRVERTCYAGSDRDADDSDE
jgi:branched-chain amino acid aminotransferase